VGHTGAISGPQTSGPQRTTSVITGPGSSQLTRQTARSRRSTDCPALSDTGEGAAGIRDRRDRTEPAHSWLGRLPTPAGTARYSQPWGDRARLGRAELIGARGRPGTASQRLLTRRPSPLPRRRGGQPGRWCPTRTRPVARYPGTGPYDAAAGAPGRHRMRTCTPAHWASLLHLPRTGQR
jgi:hypothetical protein